VSRAKLELYAKGMARALQIFWPLLALACSF